MIQAPGQGNAGKGARGGGFCHAALLPLRLPVILACCLCLMCCTCLLYCLCLSYCRCLSCCLCPSLFYLCPCTVLATGLHCCWQLRCCMLCYCAFQCLAEEHHAMDSVPLRPSVSCQSCYMPDCLQEANCKVTSTAVIQRKLSSRAPGVKKRKEKTIPLGVSLMRSQVISQAAQSLTEQQFF